MAIVELVMPKMGESIMEATVLKWHKKPGDQVKMDETLLDIATDKVDSEVPSTAAGTITSSGTVHATAPEMYSAADPPPALPTASPDDGLFP